MKYLFGMILSVMLATSAFAQQGGVVYDNPDPESQVELGTSDFDPVPGKCDYKGDFIRDECRGDPNYMRQWGVHDDPEPEDDFNTVAAQYEDGIREIWGSDELCGFVEENLPSDMVCHRQ